MARTALRPTAVGDGDGDGPLTCGRRDPDRDPMVVSVVNRDVSHDANAVVVDW